MHCVLTYVEIVKFQPIIIIYSCPGWGPELAWEPSLDKFWKKIWGWVQSGQKPQMASIGIATAIARGLLSLHIYIWLSEFSPFFETFSHYVWNMEHLFSVGGQ